MTIGIINYGMGNIRSIENALQHVVDEEVCLLNDNDCKKIDTLILPGVGAFAPAMERLKKTGVDKVLINHVKEGKKLIGICLGMQLLLDKSSEDGEHRGLGLISGPVEKLKPSKFQFEKIPSVGWHSINFKDAPDFNCLNQKKFFFVHSYHALPTDFDDILATYRRGEKNIVAAVKKDNLIGFQFHPERSGKLGLNLLKKALDQDTFSKS